jgi:hypothetical protein
MNVKSDRKSSADLSLKHLQAELARIDILIQRQVKRWQSAGQNQDDNFRGLYISDSDADKLVDRPFGTSWGHTATLSDEERERFDSLERQAIEEIFHIVEIAQTQGQSLRLEHLISTFALNPFERNVLLICVAAALDLRYERLFGYLQDDITRKLPTVNLTLELLEKPGATRLLRLSSFTESAPLFKFRLLSFSDETGSRNRSLLGQTLVADETIIAWLLGKYQPSPEIAEWTRLCWPHPDVKSSDELLAGKLWGDFQAMLGEQPILVFTGVDQLRQTAAANLYARYLDCPLLQVDLDTLKNADHAPGSAVRLVLRDAQLLGALPYLYGWDACLDANMIIPANLLEEVYEFPGEIILAGKASWQARGPDRERPLLWIAFPIPSFEQRHALWEHYLKQVAPSSHLDLTALAGQFALTSEQIRDAVSSARDIAVQRGQPLDNQDLFAAARLHSNPRLSSLARKIEPRFDWEDIVLPDDQRTILHEIVATVRGRPLVLETWGLGKKLVSSAGVTMIFAGPPGTGKTMAAEVIATELGLDLYKIELSSIVSKYIGETEKNLEKIFNEAQSSNAVLFFDEADAIFGKRSEVKDAHDRYANIEISYLLQRMEAYDGVTILATNLRANLDEAFTRRLQFAVDFPFPDENDRLRIWRTLFPPGVPRQENIDFSLLARRFKLTGGSIRNIIVYATYLAASQGGKVSMEKLLHATRRELQKMGRLIDETDLSLE